MEMMNQPLIISYQSIYLNVHGPTKNPMMKLLFNTNMVKIVYSEDFQNKRRVYLLNTLSPSITTAQYNGFGPWAFALCANLAFFT